MSDDPTTHRLTLLLADAITGEAQGRGCDDYAQREGPGRVLATVDDCEYVITIAPNTELPGVTGPDRSNWRHLYVDRKGRLFADMCVEGDAQLVASCHVDDWGDPYTLEQIEAHYGPLKPMGRIA